MRVSDAATVEVAEMVLCGSINKAIANSIKRAGGRALGISGKDDNLLMARKLAKKITDESTGEMKVRVWSCTKSSRRYAQSGVTSI